MKKLIYFLTLTTFLLFSHSLHSKSDVQIENNFKGINTSSGLGTEFYVAFPLNDNIAATIQNLAIYVTSTVDNEVTISNDSSGLKVTKLIKANETVEFSTAKGDFGWGYEIKNFEDEIEKSIKLTSLKPVSVYVLSSKFLTSDGYMAIPTKFWGTDYIHNSFYDYKEQPSVDWGGGFVVMAKEDGTNITIKLIDGANKAKGFGKTTGGKGHGETINVTLNAGEVYTVQGDGKTRAVFDLSGTNIVSDKPIGLISYHNRCMIPSAVVDNGRDYLVEMMPPINSWGTEYASIELDRKKDKGDYFRVIAGEDNMTFDIDWFDMDSSYRIGHIGPIKLVKKGDWFEYNNTGANTPHDLESIRGFASFKSDKPMLVVQYSYSANYDNAKAFDPFMILLSSKEQYVKSALFTRPQNYSNNEFRDNYISIIAIGDTTDKLKNDNLLNSLTFNGVKVSALDPNFLMNTIPGSNYYWARIEKANSTLYKMEGNALFTASIYGYATNDSYGWPATSYYKNTKITDTLSPEVVSISGDCDFKFSVKDNPMNARNGKETDKPRQTDTGIDISPTLKTGSFNFNPPKYINDKGVEVDWPIGNSFFEFDFSLSLIDPKFDAMGIIEVTDKEGNITEVTIYYSAETISIDLDTNVTIVQTRVNKEIESYLIIKNLSTQIINVNSISFKNKINFRIEEPPSPIVLQVNDVLHYPFFYTPTEEFTELKNEIDLDSIEINLDCVQWQYEISGQGYIPLVLVSNMTFPSESIGEGVSKQKGRITITNNSKSPDNNLPFLLIKSIEVDGEAPNADLFTNFTIVESNIPIEDVKDFTLNQGDSVIVEFDFNTDAVSIGDKIARLIVTTDAGPADKDGNEPTTINILGAEFDGKYTLDNPTAIADGGYIQANLTDSPQSSVTESNIVSDISLEIISANPMNISPIRFSISNKNNSNTTVNITDAEGRIIMELMNESVFGVVIKEYDISGLSSGTFFMTASDGYNKIMRKFIIAK